MGGELLYCMEGRASLSQRSMKPKLLYRGVPIYLIYLKGDVLQCFFMWFNRMIEVPEKDWTGDQAQFNREPEACLESMARTTIDTLLRLLAIGALDSQGYMVRQLTKEEAAREDS